MSMRALASCFVLGLSQASFGQLLSSLAGAEATHTVQADTGASAPQRFDLRVTDATLADVLTYLERVSGVELRPVWRSERVEDGLDREALITLDRRGATLLELIEAVLERSDEPGAWADERSTWQRLADGSIELGPRSALNRRTWTVIYDIEELVFEAPDFIDAPTIDLQQSIQQAQLGGGGGGVPLEEETGAALVTTPEERAERADEIAALVREFIEPEQWSASGGTGATMRVWRGRLVVRAPGYVHRQIR